MTRVTTPFLAGYALGVVPSLTAFTSEAASYALAIGTAQTTFGSELFAIRLVYGNAGEHFKMRASQLAVYALCKTNPDKRRLRAWTFTLNGHTFYVLRLGQLGSVVYDTATKRWSEWRSFGFPGWRAITGQNWGMEIIAGDEDEGLLWNVSPIVYHDDGDVPIERICTGGLPARQRNAMPCNAVTLVGSVGYKQGDDTVTIRLRTSDNNGADWTDHGVISQTDAGNYGVEVVWRSLGTIHAPGRIFEFTDTGVLSRIDGADMY